MADLRRGLTNVTDAMEHVYILKARSSMRSPPSMSDDLSPKKSESEHTKPALNLVLCGRKGAGKTSAAKAILGQTELHSVSISSECIRNEAEVFERRVSVVVLPALCGKPQEAAIKETSKCVSLCDPQGIHAFVLVLPAGSFTDEDKKELEIIQNTLGTQVNNFTMILFTLESEPVGPAVDNFLKQNKELQKLCRSCGGYFLLNINGKQQIPEFLDVVEKMRLERSSSFTREMFTKAQIEARLSAERHSMKRGDEFGIHKDQSRESLRMVLIGKTGSGKSATANTIVGKKKFQPKVAPKSANTTCEPATGEIDGRPVTVVNTPGLFDTTLTEEEIQKELCKCMSMLAPGPHVFLVVLQIGNMTQAEKGSVQLIKEVWGERAANYIILLFTRGEALDGQTLENYIQGCDSSVRQLFNDCGKRYQLFNNSEHADRTQVRELVTKIETMVEKNGGSCYNTEQLLWEKEQEIKKLKRELKNKSKHNGEKSNCSIQ